MLPTGHVAAGYLTGYALLKFAHPALEIHQQTQLLWWATFFGFAPDLDVFYFFIRNKTLLVSGEAKSNHRFYFSHAPVLWLLAGLGVYFFGSSIYIKDIGLLLWLGSWSHFLVDSVEYGVMWLWPFSTKIYAFKNQGVKVPVSEQSFFRHSFQFLKIYSRRLSFYLEMVIIISALAIFLHH